MAPGARVWITRTLPGAETTTARVKALGFEPVVSPLLEVRPIHGAFQDAPPPQTIACIALTSPNTISAIKDSIAGYIGVPAYCVGDTTARAAFDAGFTTVYSAAGDIHALAKLIADKVASGVVFAPGAEQPAGDLAALLPAHDVIRLPVYSTAETHAPIPDAISIALVHSPRAGGVLANMLRGAPQSLTIIAISDAAARPFSGLADLKLVTADHPDEEAMLRALGKSGLAV